MLKTLWIVQLVLNGLWSWMFFGLHRSDWGLLDIILMLTSIAALIVVARQHSQTRLAWLMLPYLIWVACAASLNIYIFWYNQV